MTGWRFWLWRSWLWWRLSWPFRFAHAPLCPRRHAESWRLGPLWLCRSCTLFYAGIFTAFVTALSMTAFTPSAFLSSVSLLSLIVLASYPPWYEHYSRRIKDVLRLGAGLGVGVIFAAVVSPLGWIAAGVVLVLWLLFRRYRRLRLQLGDSGCAGCPELGRGDVCSGYARQADAFRAYRNLLEDEFNRPDRLPLPIVKVKRLHSGGGE